MRRRHVGHPRIAGAPHAGLDVQALRVDPHREDPGPRAHEGAPRPGIAGILHPRPIPRVEQQAADQVEALLGAGDHHDLVGVALRAPSGPDVGGDRLAKDP